MALNSHHAKCEKVMQGRGREFAENLQQVLFRENSYSVARNTENLARDTVSANQNTTERNWKKAKNNETKTEKNSLNRTKALHYP